MITVSIIGIMAALALPQYERYRNQARQAEAKLSLSAIFALQKSFHAEYNAYIPAFDAIGYRPEGTRRYYRYGWQEAGTYTATVKGYVGSRSVIFYPNFNSPYDPTQCGLGHIPGLPFPNSGPFASDDPQSFVVGAIGCLRYTAALANCPSCDQWTINNLKTLANVRKGL